MSEKNNYENKKKSLTQNLKVTSKRETFMPKDMMMAIHTGGQDVQKLSGQCYDDWNERRKNEIKKRSLERAKKIGNDKQMKWDNRKINLEAQKSKRKLERDKRRQRIDREKILNERREQDESDKE